MWRHRAPRTTRMSDSFCWTTTRCARPRHPTTRCSPSCRAPTRRRRTGRNGIARCWSAPRNSALPLRLDLVPPQLRDVRPADVLPRADAGRRGNIDLGEPAADHVDADEQEPALAQVRPEALTDLALARRQLGFLRRAAAHPGGARIGRGHG